MTSGLRTLLFLVSIGLASVASSCGTHSSGIDTEAGDAAPEDARGGCGSPVPKVCPDPPPSYENDVAPIMDAKCNNCHIGGDGPWPLTDRQLILDWRRLVVHDLEACTMPPLDAGTTLSAVERDTLLAWLVCETPDN